MISEMRLNFPSSNPLVSRPESGEGGTTNRADLWEGLLSLIAALNKNIVSPDCLFTTTVHCQFSVFNQCQPGRPTSTFLVLAMTFDIVVLMNGYRCLFNFLISNCSVFRGNVILCILFQMTATRGPWDVQA